MNNKKKYIVAAAAVIICSIMFMLTVKVQKMYGSGTANKKTESQVSQNDTPANANLPDVTDNDDKKADGDKTVDMEQRAKAAGIASNDKTTESKKEQNSTVVQEKSKNGTAANNDQNKSQGVKESKPAVQNESNSDSKEEPTFTIMDAVHNNKVIFQKDVDGEGQTVGQITCKLLDEANIKYKAKGTPSTIYFSSIDNLEEKKAGPLSGWCFYIKKSGESSFAKASVGCGQYVLKKGDIVLWKYVENGM